MDTPQEQPTPEPLIQEMDPALKLRIEIGSALGLNVGTPNAKRSVLGKAVEERDELGLWKDPMVYALKDCANCCGRGVVYLRRPIPLAVVMKLVAENPANEALLERKEKVTRTRKKGKVHEDKRVTYWQRQPVPCGCAKNRYDAARGRFARALQDAGIKI